MGPYNNYNLSDTLASCVGIVDKNIKIIYYKILMGIDLKVTFVGKLLIENFERKGDLYMNGIIYCSTCIVNGKQYIGQTTKTLNARKRGHKFESKTSDTKLYRAIRKYGFNKFIWEILANNISSHDDLNNLEQFWIAKLDTHNKGYNSTDGGEGIIRHKASEETKKKLSLSHIGHTHTDETRLMIGKSSSIRHKGEGNPNAILTESQVGEIKRLLVNGSGNAELGRSYNVSANTILSIKQVKSWKFVLPKLNNLLIQKLKPTQKPVLQMDIKTENILAQYPSATAASLETNIDPSSITKVCRKRKLKTTGGYKWAYKDEYMNS